MSAAEAQIDDDGQDAAARPGIEPVIELRGIFRFFKQGEGRLEVLRGARLSVYPGEIIALIGPSGSGKSSLLHVAGLLEKPTAGHVLIGGRDCVPLSDEEKTRIRRENVGFVYQFHQLLPEFTALENVVLPQLVAAVPRKRAEAEGKRLLASLGLAKRFHHRPMELSGGEQQRVAIARALANQPEILLADEPTGNLDPKTAGHVFDELIKVIREEGRAAIIATHNLELANRMDRAVVLRDGKLLDARHDMIPLDEEYEPE